MADKRVTSRKVNTGDCVALPSSNKDENNVCGCGICKKAVTDDDKALCCEVCELWFHIKCEGVPVGVYNFIADDEAGAQFLWHCSHCKRGCVKLKKHIERVEKQQLEILNKQTVFEEQMKEMHSAVAKDRTEVTNLMDRVGNLELKSIESSEHSDKIDVKQQNMESRLDSVEAKILTVEEKIQSGPNEEHKLGGGQHVTGTVPWESYENKLISELNDRKKRENNIIIYNAPESHSNQFLDRISHDKEILRKLVNCCGIDNEGLVRVSRLGKLVDGQMRPMLAVLSSSDIKKEIFKNIKNITEREDLKNVRVSNDLTKRERERLK